MYQLYHIDLWAVVKNKGNLKIFSVYRKSRSYDPNKQEVNVLAVLQFKGTLKSQHTFSRRWRLLVRHPACVENVMYIGVVTRDHDKHDHTHIKMADRSPQLVSLLQQLHSQNYLNTFIAQLLTIEIVRRGNKMVILFVWVVFYRYTWFSRIFTWRSSAIKLKWAYLKKWLLWFVPKLRHILYQGIIKYLVGDSCGFFIIKIFKIWHDCSVKCTYHVCYVD